MAYVSQELKARIAPVVREICKKYGVKGTLSVHHHTSLSLKISKGSIDFVSNYVEIAKDLTHVPKHIRVNEYAFRNHFSGQAREFLIEVIAAMNDGNHDRSDLQTDYFDVGWWTSINIGQWDKPYIVV